ncbi:MAG: hypothetical protein ACYC27_07470 [Armatimonadota bacterium]
MQVNMLQTGAFPQLMADRYTAQDGLPSGDITRIRIAGINVFAGTSDRTFILEGDRWMPSPSDSPADMPVLLPDGTEVTSAVRTPKGEIWMVTSSGAFRVIGEAYAPLISPEEALPLHQVIRQDAEIRKVCADNTGNVWIATDSGICVTDGDKWWQPINRTDGMPYEDVTCLAFAPNGDIWGGTTEGAWRLRGGQWRYFWGKRWLPGNKVNDIAVAEDGSAWIATDGGVSRIYEQQIGFGDKAAHYEEITAVRHSRRGWVASSHLRVPGDISAGVKYITDDNDGLWTAMYVGAEAYRYAVTGDPNARQLCVKSMNAILDLVRLSGYPGFPVRSIIHEDEEVDGYTPDETVRIEGALDRIWYRSPVDPSLICKGDTSSDELDGHYFAWYLFHELVADDREKAELRTVVAAVTDNLLRNGFNLVGHTGKPTRWGIFGPQYLNDNPDWCEERGLNSSSILSYLKVAHHICGDQRYADAYDDLIDNHHYLLNSLEHRRDWPWYLINHSDDELAFLVYYPWLMLEKEPQRHAIIVQAMSRAWRDIRHERSSLYNFIYGTVTGMPCETEDAVETLRDWPWDLVQWDIRNSHRHDVTLRVSPDGRRLTETDRVLPVSERQVWRWNGNPWIPDGGRGGMTEEDAMSWLLPYWMGRYHHLISE